MFAIHLIGNDKSLTSQPEPTLPLSIFQAMPKVDLHRHLEGSLRLATMIDIARAYGVTLPITAHLRPLVQVQAQEDAYLSALEKVATYAIEGDRLEMRDATGAAMVGYTAQ